MKKYILSLLLAKTLLLANGECPKLDIENTSGKPSEQILKELDSLEWAKNIYLDILRKYNGTADVKKFISEDSLAEISSTQIWASLIGYNYTMDTNSYEIIMDSIDADNPNWCNSSSYKKLLHKKD